MSAGDQTPALPDDVRRFISDYIDSVERLEVLLLLHRQSRQWTPIEVSDERRTSETAANLHLKGLVASGMVVAEEGRYRIHSDTTLAQMLDRLGAVYRERHVSVITFIYTRPEGDSARRPPVDPLRSFVDAFRIKGEGGDKKNG